MSLVHVCAPRPVDKRVISGVCPDCQKRSRFLLFFYEWYGATQTCLRCGRRWCDGEWMPLEFYRFARRDNINEAKAAWRRSTIAKTATPE